jgi:hypothetical protein
MEALKQAVAEIEKLKKLVGDGINLDWKYNRALLCFNRRQQRG